MIAAEEATTLDRRVVVVTPTSRDAAITRRLLHEAHIPVETCASLDDLLDELGRGAAAILIPEELVTTEPAAGPSAVTPGNTIAVIVTSSFQPLTAFIPNATWNLTGTARMVVSR